MTGCTHGLPDHGVLYTGQADFLFQQERVEGGLSAHGNGPTYAGGLAQNRILALGVGHIVVVGEPHAGCGSGGASRNGDPLGIEIPFLGLAAEKLDGPGGVMDGSRQEFRAGETVIDRGIAVTLVELVGPDGLMLLAAQPTAAVDMN